MGIISNKTKVQDLVRALSIQYDKFFTNRQYKNTQFENNETEYMRQQNELANDIKKEEDQIFEILKQYFNEVFPELNLIAYDSRFVAFSKSRVMLGVILVENIKDGDESKIKRFLMENLFVEVKVDKLEDLPEEIRKKFKK